MVRQAQTVIRGSLLVVAGIALLATGCVGLRGHKRADDPQPAKVVESKPKGKSGPAVQSLATWRKQVQRGTNPATNKDIAAITGRFYLFDKTGGHPILGDGKVKVELYDDSNRGQGANSKLMEVWNLDTEHFKQLAQRDALGDGYTLTLPWSTYKQDVSQVHLVVTYEPKAGAPLTTASQVMTLEHDSPEEQIARRSVGSPGGVIQASAKQ